MAAIIIDVFLKFLMIVIEKSMETANIMKKYIAENESKIKENDKKNEQIAKSKSANDDAKSILSELFCLKIDNFKSYAPHHFESKYHQNHLLNEKKMTFYR